MEELKPKLILTKSGKSGFNIGRYIFFIIIFSIGFYFGYSYKSLDSDIISQSKDQLTKIKDKKFTNLEFKDSAKKQPDNKITVSKNKTVKVKAVAFNKTDGLIDKKSDNDIASLQIKKNVADMGSVEKVEKLPKTDTAILANNVTEKTDNKAKNSNTVKKEQISQSEHKLVINDSQHVDTSYTLQIAAFETERKSSEVVQELSNKGYNVYSISVVNAHGDRWNLVRLGNFETLEEAREFSELLLSSEGINSIVKSIEKSKVTSSTKFY
ncbi:MAG TPA: SPOR domain-containing protein [Thermodesulfobacteriota bacterium]|nr:SPOR domain-containing protein [Thermodesulfobacteriota bacterium]